MNCYFCQKPCKFVDQKGNWKILTCHDHANQVDHVVDVDDNVLYLVEFPLRHHDKNYRVSYDVMAHFWELNEIYGWVWHAPYTTIRRFESDFNVSPDNLQDKLKLILTFL